MEDLFADEDLSELGEHLEIMSALLAGFITPKCAADWFASLVFLDDPYEEINDIWNIVVDVIRDGTDEHREKIVEMLVHMASLPPVLDANGQQVMIDVMRLWEDLPTLRWVLRDFYHTHLDTNGDSIQQAKGFKQFVNMNKAMALFFNTGLEALDCRMLGLWTMRSALETPLSEMNSEDDPPDAVIPAAAAWVTIAGTKLYQLDLEFEYSDLGSAGLGGGPLWKDEQGLGEERWSFWRRRFGELYSSSELSDDLRDIAKQAADRMWEIEDQQT